MYYSSGNYEAFARPRKPSRADSTRAYLVGAGLASLAAAAFLVRDAQVPGERITILEAGPLPGGACDGIEDPNRDGFLVRGGREMENHFECLWDLFRSVPSLATPGASVLDEFYWLNKDDPNFSLMRATRDQGNDGGTNGEFTLSPKAQRDLTKLFLTRDEDLYDKKITDVLGPEFLAPNFWLYWRTMFAFQEWHSALEMKLWRTPAGAATTRRRCGTTRCLLAGCGRCGRTSPGRTRASGARRSSSGTGTRRRGSRRPSPRWTSASRRTSRRSAGVTRTPAAW